MLRSNSHDPAQQLTRHAVALVLQQPRDYQKLAAIANTLGQAPTVYVIDNFCKGGRYSAEATALLERHNVAWEFASDVIAAGSRFALGIYQTSTRRKHSQYRRQPLPAWLWFRFLESRLSWTIAVEVAGDSAKLSVSRTVQLVRGGLLWFISRVRGLHLGRISTRDQSDSIPTQAHGNKRSSGRPAREPRRHPHIVTLATGFLKAAAKPLADLALVPVPLGQDLSAISVLAPPYYDDVAESFPEAHVRHAFDYYLVASERQGESVRRALGERVQVIGYPQYWSTQSTWQSRKELRNALMVDGNSRVIAWLPLSKTDLKMQMDSIRPVLEAYEVVLQPHPDLYLAENQRHLDEVENRARALGIHVQGSRSLKSGLLIRGADLVVAEGVSSLLSSLYLGANVVVGLSAPSAKFRMWDSQAGANLAGLECLDMSHLSGQELADVLKQPSWWTKVERTSRRVRRAFFGETTSLDVGRDRCAAALDQLAARMIPGDVV